jgi:hypothetical protein
MAVFHGVDERVRRFSATGYRFGSRRLALAALEQVDLLGQHEPAGLRAIAVLRGLIPAAA